MPYGKITPEMKEALQPIVRHRRVWDLGCGDLGHTDTLRGMRAIVVAVDKEWPRGKLPRGASFHLMTYQILLELEADEASPVPSILSTDIAFLSWPSNHPMPKLLDLLERFSTVIYLGSNLDGSACGWPALFEHFLRRDLDVQLTSRRNSMLIYGPLGGSHEPILEEKAALDNVFMYSSIPMSDVYTEDPR